MRCLLILFAQVGKLSQPVIDLLESEDAFGLGSAMRFEKLAKKKIQVSNVE